MKKLLIIASLCLLLGCEDSKPKPTRADIHMKYWRGWVDRNMPEEVSLTGKDGASIYQAKEAYLKKKGYKCKRLDSSGKTLWRSK